VLGIDLGERRIGVAVSDVTGTLATPLAVIRRTGDRQADHRALAAVAAEENVGLVVVGLPLSLDGTLGPAAERVRSETGELAAALAVPVEMWDERLTTVSADRSLRALGRDGRARRQVVDKVAAAVLLQSWLEARR
jgi:putative Holliday junction resolvase